MSECMGVALFAFAIAGALPATEPRRAAETRGARTMYDDLIGTMVVVRTYSAGVHFGTLAAVDGRKVKLADARRIWYWKGANTLHEIATAGVDVSKSKVSAPVSKIVLTQAIEVLAMTPAAVMNLAGATWAS